MNINQQAFMSGMVQQLEKRALLGAILGPIQAMQAKKGQGWTGAGHGLLQGSAIGSGGLLGGSLGYTLGSLLGGETTPHAPINLAQLIPMLAGIGLGGYGGHRIFKNVIGPQRQAEVFGKDESDEYDYYAPLRKTKEGKPDYWAGLPKKKKEEEKQASLKKEGYALPAAAAGATGLMALLKAMQAKEGKGWQGAGYGASKALLTLLGSGLGGIGGAGLGGTIGGLAGIGMMPDMAARSSHREEISPVSLLMAAALPTGGMIGGGALGGLAGLGAGGYGGYKLTDALFGPKFQQEVFGEGEDEEEEKKAQQAQQLWGALSGAGKGKGQLNGGRRNINLEPCPDEGPGKAKGKGRGKGKNR